MQTEETRNTEKVDGQEGGTERTRVAFSPEQQARVQELIDDAYRKAFAKARKVHSAPEEVERLRSEVETLRGEKKRLALLKAVSRYNVVDAEEVTRLIEDRVRMDEEGNVIVVNEKGSTMIDNSGHPVSLEEFISGWLSSRPHHLRAGRGSGAGSTGAAFTGGAGGSYSLADPSSWRKMPRRDLDRFLAEGINVYGTAGQVYRFRDVKNPFLEARRKGLRSRT